ncbi:MAG: ribbon-helix-helix protein, CopG family, partial [Patescibacteria group bacterium]|nr:ribbon-helix-helix protein, CopG family [Patescibacteria group bacterium]
MATKARKETVACRACRKPLRKGDFYGVPAHAECLDTPVPAQEKTQQKRKETKGVAKILVHIPAELLTKIDASYKGKYRNRSELIRDALRKHLGEEPIVSRGIPGDTKKLTNIVPPAYRGKTFLRRKQCAQISGYSVQHFANLAAK